ncbi:uncharacterized protein LOC128549635 [Mercenaria mercenaria]|uniref:uncharacterized protein LOC128549635 n=1 Tax=Mercenaria mercenaria TaxID=6596 RepID=UPI00234FAAC5|nr:uncharacterized protein LOC128549635 [Mercenaria mercenaria]
MQLLMIQIQVLVTIGTSLHFAGCATFNSDICACKDDFWIGTECPNRTCDRNTSYVQCYCLMMQPLNGGIIDTDVDKVNVTCERKSSKLLEENNQTCLNSENWSNPVRLCVPKGCELFFSHLHVDVINIIRVPYECKKTKKNIKQGMPSTKSAASSKRTPKKLYHLPGPKYQKCLHTDDVACPQTTDSEGHVWIKSSPGEHIIACPTGFSGNLGRICSSKDSVK